MEFWAVIGLACLDHVFLKELIAHANHVEGTVRKYGFRLSLYEMGELKRILRIPSAVECMRNISTVGWEYALKDPNLCAWSAAISPINAPPTKSKRVSPAAANKSRNTYIHPLTNRPEVEQKDFVLGAKPYSGSRRSGSNPRKQR